MSDENDDSQKTEDPTQKRLDEARRKGQVAISRELNNWLMLTAATILIGTSSRPLMRHLTEYLQGFIERAGTMPSGPGGLTGMLFDMFKAVLGMLLLPLLVLMAAAFLGPFLQVGPIFAPDVIKPDLSKLSPIKGWERLFSRRAIMEFVKGLLKIGIIGTAGTLLLSPYFGQAEHMVGLPLSLLMSEIYTLVMRLLVGILAILLIVAIIDVVYQRVEFHKKLRMSKQEIKDEYKQSEGDPHVKAKLRQLRTERARKRMMQAVPRADVVITNPTHFAIALEYKPATMEAPICLAKGADDLALRIRAEAEKHKITIFENPPLARVLYATVEVDEEVPPEHYKAVAEVISFVFRKTGKMK
jgi:flagellar biosynthetic protein FlhB